MSPPHGEGRPHKGNRPAPDASNVPAIVTPTADNEVLLAERAVVGAALLGHPDGLRTLALDDLTCHRLRAAAQAAMNLHRQGRPADPLAVLIAMAARSDYPWPRSGGAAAAFVAELTSVEVCPLPASAGFLAAQVRRESCRRRLRLAADRLAAFADDQPVEPERLLRLLNEEYAALLAAVEWINDGAGVAL